MNLFSQHAIVERVNTSKQKGNINEAGYYPVISLLKHAKYKHNILNILRSVNKLIHLLFTTTILF